MVASSRLQQQRRASRIALFVSSVFDTIPRARPVKQLPKSVETGMGCVRRASTARDARSGGAEYSCGVHSAASTLQWSHHCCNPRT